MIMDQSLASLVTRERDDYFGRFIHSLGVTKTTLQRDDRAEAENPFTDR